MYDIIEGYLAGEAIGAIIGLFIGVIALCIIGFVYACIGFVKLIIFIVKKISAYREKKKELEHEETANSFEKPTAA